MSFQGCARDVNYCMAHDDCVPCRRLHSGLAEWRRIAARSSLVKGLLAEHVQSGQRHKLQVNGLATMDHRPYISSCIFSRYPAISSNTRHTYTASRCAGGAGARL